VSADSLSGSWTHSHEEDCGDLQVYRPTHAFAFAPGRRGRETLEFDAIGQMVLGTPGANDRQSRIGLTNMGMNRYRIDGGQTAGQIIEIIETQPDLLKIRML
jgi:hypothetical protein